MKKLKALMPKQIKKVLRETHGMLLSAGKQKVFGIGFNKTGTTSLAKAMADLGFIVGYQRTGEELIQDWSKRDFTKIIKYCKTGQFFQDVPLSLPYTFIVLDQYFPGSKFILTVRDSSDQWYQSITSFHAKKWGKNGRIPTKEDLMAASYIYKGRAWDSNRLIFDTPETDPYQKENLKSRYEFHNESVRDYFRFRPNDLLELNVAAPGAYQKLCGFLGVKAMYEGFPWENKTGVK